jgi:hypothetical protein
MATALVVIAFVAAAQSYIRRASSGAALLLGAALGAIGLIRVYTALLLILLLGAWLLATRRRIVGTDFLIALGGLPLWRSWSIRTWSWAARS